MPTVEDELWFEGLTVELQARVRRLFQKHKEVRDVVDAAYARGHRRGIEDGKRIMLNEIKDCEICKYRTCLRHTRAKV